MCPLLSFFSLVPLFYYSHPREARVEFGDVIASQLKLSPDGETILWPQPSGDPEDPQNVRLCLKAVNDYSLIDPMLCSGPNGGRLFS